ncbi:MAG: hypothetical protein ACI8SK_001156 [Shewanella sp.]|jgi:hypothetical protein
MVTISYMGSCNIKRILPSEDIAIYDFFSAH